MKNYIANWHNHTYRCKHAAGDASDYCAEAVKLGMKVLGISDHAPMKDGRSPYVRMEASLLPEYIAAIDKAKFEYPELKVYKGLECEWIPEFGKSYYDDELRAKFGLDYIAGGAHFFPLKQNGETTWCNSFARESWINQTVWIRAYADYVIEMLGTGCYDFMAHPDLIGCFCTKWTHDAEAASRDIAQAARDTHTPLEINTSGIRKPHVEDEDGATRAQYPWLPFWQIAAEEGVTAIINTDAHAPKLIAATVDEAYELAETAGIKVLTPLKPSDFALA